MRSAIKPSVTLGVVAAMIVGFLVAWGSGFDPRVLSHMVCDGSLSRFYTFLILAICALGILIPIPNFMSKEAYDRLSSFAKHKIGLGLDLRGGAHFLYKIDTDELRRAWLVSLSDQARAKLREAKLGFSNIGQGSGGVSVKLVSAADTDAALKALRPIAQPVGSAACEFALRHDSLIPRWVIEYTA